MSKISPLAPLLDIHTLSLEKSDLVIDQQGYGVNDIDATLVQSLDSAWLKIMQERGVFTGRHENKIVALQNVAKKLKQSKDDVKSELKKQTLFVRNNRDAMETMFKRQMHETIHEKDMLGTKLKERSDLIGDVKESTEAIVHWHHFTLELNRLAALSNINSHQPNDAQIQSSSLYRDRAVYLAGKYKCTDSKHNDTNIILQRAARVENALLKSHVKMIGLEIRRRKAAMVLQRDVGMVVKELQRYR